MKSVVLYCFIILLFIPVFSQNIQFYREDLNFKLEENRFFVDGLYYFRNLTNNPIHRTLFYPLTLDSVYGGVDSVFAINIKDIIENTNLKIQNSGASITISIEPDSTAVYLIGYRQEIKHNKAEYILTTTQSWGKPFEQVKYTLDFSKDLKLDSLSYMPDSLMEDSHYYKFFWYKEDFMPDRNLIIEFHKD